MDMAIIPTTSVTPVDPADNNEPHTSETQPNKRRRKKSIVWDHFTVETVGAGCTRACCNQCKKSFAYITGSKLAGTSHLKRHIALGICPVSRQKNELSPYGPGSKSANGTDPPKKRYRASPGFAGISFNQGHCNHEIAKMIIMHEYPLHIVEHRGFSDFVRTLQPQFDMMSFNSIHGDCVAMYLREKQGLLDFIFTIPGRVSLTLDLWTSNQTVGYVLLTGHFIDGDWILHRRLLNVVMVPYPESDDALSQAVVTCLSDWHLEGRLFSLTLNQVAFNESQARNVSSFLSVRNPLILNGQLLIGNCYARTISCLVQDALGAMKGTVEKIRDNVKYVKTSDAHEEKFMELKQQLQVPSTEDLSLDDRTKWNTTYHMLSGAFELKEVFSCLQTSDPDYKIAPSMDDWRQVEILCTYLKFFFDAVNILTGPKYPAANAFYHELSKIQLELTHAAMSPDPFISNLTRPLKEKFDKYWISCCLVLAIAVVMDPRFKLKLIEFSFPKIYGENAGTWIKIVDDGLHELFLEYVMQALPPPEAYMEVENENFPKTETAQDEPLQEGQPQDGHHPGGYPQDGHPEGVCLQEGFHEDGQPQEGLDQDGHHPGGYPQDGHPEGVCLQEGFHEDGQPQEGLDQDGQSQEGLHEDGQPQGLHQNGQPQEALHQNGQPQEGLHQDGQPQEGLREDGHSQRGNLVEGPPHGHTPEVPPQDLESQEGPLQDLQSQGGPPQDLLEGASQRLDSTGGSLQEEQLQDLPLISIGDGLSDFEVYISEITSSQQKSELDQYLEESLLPRVQDFDILSWWRLNKLKYPTLSRMASDILSIPVSTVPPESVFDTGIKKVDSYRSSLPSVTLEALICAKDWLQYGMLSSSSSSLEVPNGVVKMEG